MWPLEWLRCWRRLDNLFRPWLLGPKARRRRQRPPRRTCRLEVTLLEDRDMLSVSATGTAFLALRNENFTGIVGSFSPAAGTTPSDYLVNIQWGDGSQSAGTIDSSFNVLGSH